MRWVDLGREKPDIQGVSGRLVIYMQIKER